MNSPRRNRGFVVWNRRLTMLSHQARLSPTERPPRAHASHAQALRAQNRQERTSSSSTPSSMTSSTATTTSDSTRQSACDVRPSSIAAPRASTRDFPSSIIRSTKRRSPSPPVAASASGAAKSISVPSSLVRPFDGDSKPQPPHRQSGKLEERTGAGERHAVVGANIVSLSAVRQGKSPAVRKRQGSGASKGGGD